MVSKLLIKFLEIVMIFNSVDSKVLSSLTDMKLFTATSVVISKFFNSYFEILILDDKAHH